MPLRYLALAATLAAPLDPPDTDNQPFWTGHPDAAAFERAVEGRLVRARGILARLVAVTGTRTVSNTLAPYDHLMRELDRAASEAGLIRSVHPDSAVRQAAERSDQRVSAFATEISLSPGATGRQSVVVTVGGAESVVAVSAPERLAPAATNSLPKISFF